MREILFRGKIIDEDIYCEWLENKDVSIAYSNAKWFYGYPVLDTFDSEWAIYLKNRCETFYNVVYPETLCEYTGITDKKGNKIFEGDIFHIEKENYYGVVRYGRYCNPFNDDPDRRHVGFYVEWKNRPELLRKDLAFWSYECEVVGNIFDNPELIENKE